MLGATAALRCCLLLATLVAASGRRRALAEPEDYHLRVAAGAGIMTSPDQIAVPFSYDRPLLLAGAQLERVTLSWLDLRGGLQVTGFLRENHALQKNPPGGLLDATVGAVLHVPRTKVGPYITADGGAGVTGALFRPYFSVGVGFDAPIGARHAIGPVFGYSQLVQWNHPNFTSDARYIWFAVSVRRQFRSRQREPEKQAASTTRVVVVREREVITEREPAPEPSEDVISLIERALPSPSKRVELLAPVLFAYDSDALEPSGTAMLHEVLATLQTHPEMRLIQIQGHADQQGPAAYNRALSERRAERVKSWLVAHGVASERLTVDPHGASDPVESASTDDAREQNRRVIFRVLEQDQEAAP